MWVFFDDHESEAERNGGVSDSTTDTSQNISSTSDAAAKGNPDGVLYYQQRELSRVFRALKDNHNFAPFLYWKAGPAVSNNSNNSFVTNNISNYNTGNAIAVRPAVLVRPYFYTTLSDRLASRPFLDAVEKLWIVYQLLRALDDLHNSASSTDDGKIMPIVHGFLTTENVGLSSWNWVVLLDLSASYKGRTALPDDDPSEYLYYFQERQTTAQSNATSQNIPDASTTTREKRCYLAPERFFTPGNGQSNKSAHDKKGEEFESSETIETSASSSSSTKITAQTLTPAMDIFSAGCCIMETFLNGERAFDLGDLMEYRQRKTYTPTLEQKLNKIEFSSLRAACKHMLSLDPSQRLSAREYLDRLEASGLLPSSFDTLERLMKEVTTNTSSSSIPPHRDIEQNELEPDTGVVVNPDARLAKAAACYATILYETTGIFDEDGKKYFEKVLGQTAVANTIMNGNNQEINKKLSEVEIISPVTTEEKKESDQDTLFAETDALLKKLESLTVFDEVEVVSIASEEAMSFTHQSKEFDEQNGNKISKVTDKGKVRRSQLSESSLLIYLQLVLSTVRHVQRPASKLVALQLMNRVGKHSTDEAKLQRIVPVVVSLLQDQDPLVRASAVEVLTSIMSIVESFPPSDSKVFPQYIFKRVAHLVTDPSLVVRLAFARSVAVLAETAHRFLDISHAVRLYEAVGGGGDGRRGGSTATSQNKKVSASSSNVFGDEVAKLLGESASIKKDNPKTLSRTDSTETIGSDIMGAGRILISSAYSSDLGALHETVSRWVIHITTDASEHSSPAKRALLNDMARLCNFFGLDGVMAFILPQILSFLNDRKDWQLRASLFEHLQSVCQSIGRAATEHFVLPILETALVDSEEVVISRALHCISELLRMGLLSRGVFLGRLAQGGSDESPGYIVGPLDSEVFVVPIIRLFLRFPPSSGHLSTPQGLEKCLYPAWTRERFEKELNRLIAAMEASPTGSLKLAQKIKFPRQDIPGSPSATLPSWYGTLLESQYGQVENVRETAAIRSVSALGKIYGLSIMDQQTEVNSTSSDMTADRAIESLQSRKSKTIEAACRGEWGSETCLDPALTDTSLLLTKLNALNVPPLPPRLSEEKSPIQRPSHPSRQYAREAGDPRDYSQAWKPKIDNVIATSRRAPDVGHTAPVIRLAVSHDQRFFVSGSHDGTCRVWEAEKAEKSNGVLESSLTYSMSNTDVDRKRVNDLVMIEGSHSVASANSDGSVHVWRVDLVSSSSRNLTDANKDTRRVAGSTEIKRINPSEGEILAVNQFNNQGSSLLTFATQKYIHSWDLRCANEPFCLKNFQDTGYITNMAIGSDRNWVVVGTNRGFISLWDLRFQQMMKLWHHSRSSPINRLATSFVPPPQSWVNKGSTSIESKPYIFVASGPNECGMFDVTTGHCSECFRTVEYGSRSPSSRIDGLPRLTEMPLSTPVRRKTLLSQGIGSAKLSDVISSSFQSVNCMVGSTGNSDQSFLITGGCDRRIRYWDFSMPSKCHVTNGLDAVQSRPSFERIDYNNNSRLMLCRQAPAPTLSETGSSKTPRKLFQGTRTLPQCHNDSICDLKFLKNSLLSCSRDCTVKLWR
ncbi:WD40 repeat-like protein [Fragilariopsis cylindrus CCMP1102]|uniref:non-specific serine/threonine protein kinase n=1 Tax=Fragilariopsis cylindrus CCMP1102 TaxID=635003 RepID=A0A1E7FAR2_9STRA|nr:WD40 repeat-like protein [Fragilariopsis cylindrus CCMP1102]|eukprot:OEU15239.1 WD40 repeat-like protein [Fragilariopsis cylindrus CCMP1102]